MAGTSADWSPLILMDRFQKTHSLLFEPMTLRPWFWDEEREHCRVENLCRLSNSEGPSKRSSDIPSLHRILNRITYGILHLRHSEKPVLLMGSTQATCRFASHCMAIVLALSSSFRSNV